MVDVETPQRHQYPTGPQPEGRIDGPLQPGLLDGDLGLIRSLDGLFDRHAAFGLHHLFQLQQPEAFQFQLREKAQVRGDRHVGGEHEATEGERVVLVLQVGGLEANGAVAAQACPLAFVLRTHRPGQQ